MAINNHCQNSKKIFLIVLKTLLWKNKLHVLFLILIYIGNTKLYYYYI